MNEVLAYGARVISVIGLAMILLAIFNSMVGRIRIEARLRSYAMFIVLLLVTAMLVDITALSEHVKNGLIGGLSLGVGISIGSSPYGSSSMSPSTNWSGGGRALPGMRGSKTLCI